MENRTPIVLGIFSIYIFLSLLGILMVYSSSSIYAWKVYADSEYFLKRQLIFFTLGLVLFFTSLKINQRYLKKSSILLLAISLFMLVGVLIWGRQVGGAKRWFRLGGYNLQVSEFAKIFLVVYLADYISRRKNIISTFRGILPPLFITGIIGGLVLLEPDFGGAVFMLFLGVFLLFIAGMRAKHLLAIFIGGVFIFSLLIFSSPYRLRRITAFVNPWQDPKGLGFQITQAQIAFGRGGLLGRGLGKGLQKHFYLPASHTDFILAVVGEELGFLGVFLVVGLFFLLFYLCLSLLRGLKEDFSFYLGWGCLGIIVFQAILNMGVVAGLLPTKGLPLPFLSYGGSSYLSCSLVLSLFLNAAARKK